MVIFSAISVISVVKFPLFSKIRLVFLGQEEVILKGLPKIDPKFLLSRASLNAYRNFGLGRGYHLGGDPLSGLGSSFVGRFRSRLGGWLGDWLGSGLGDSFVDNLGSGFGSKLGSWLGSGLGGWLGGNLGSGFGSGLARFG
jgi:hypothetical protein